MGNTVAILVRRFPKLSETFILGEIANLVDSGTDVEILSLFEPSDRLQQLAATRFLDRVTYLNRIFSPAAYAALLLALLRNPAGLISLLRITRHDRHLLRRLGALLLSCRRLGVRHIHAHYVSEPAALAAAAANIRKLKFSISAHAKDIYLTPKEDIADRIARAEFIATCTRHNLDHLRGLTIDHKDRVHLVYHGIDTKLFRPDDAAVPHEPPVLLAVGRFKEKKGFDLLVGACAELVARSIDFRCEIIGYGDQEGRLQSLITRHQLGDKVALCPPIDHVKLRTIYRAATIFVLPCRLTADGDRDGIPNAMLEAMASGLPIVGTSVSGIPEVVTDGANGLLVPPENPQALADAVERLLRDPQLRHRLGKSGRQTVLTHFCWERNIAKLVQLLQQSGRRRSFTIRQAQ